MPYSARALGQETLRLRSRRVRCDRSHRQSVLGWKTLVVGLILIAGLVSVGSPGIREYGLRLPAFDVPALPRGVSAQPSSVVRPSTITTASGVAAPSSVAVRAGAEAPSMVASSSTVVAGAGAEAPPGLVMPSAPAAPSPASGSAPPRLDEQRYLEALWPIHARLGQSVARMGLLAAFYESQEIDRSELKTRLDEGLASYRHAEEQMRALKPPPKLLGPHEGYLATLRLFQQSALEMLKLFDDDDDAHVSAAVPLSLEGTTRMRELGDQFWPD